MELTSKQVAALADDILALANDAAGDTAAYLEEFAGYAAGMVASLLVDPDPGGLERLEAQTLAVLETVDEISDQAARKAIVTAIVRAARFLSTVAAAA